MNRHIPSDKSNFIKNLASKGASQSLTDAMRNFHACDNYVVAEVVSDVYISLHISYKLPFISGITDHSRPLCQNPKYSKLRTYYRSFVITVYSCTCSVPSLSLFS